MKWYQSALLLAEKPNHVQYYSLRTFGISAI